MYPRMATNTNVAFISHPAAPKVVTEPVYLNCSILETKPMAGEA